MCGAVFTAPQLRLPVARANDVIEPFDLPITKGLQENIHRFRRIDMEIELEPILEHLAASHRSTGAAARRRKWSSRTLSEG